MSEITKQTYTDQVVTYVKKGILNGAYDTGSKVNEARIAKELSISRAPIREALQILIKEGLVVWIPQKGKFIRKLDPQNIRDSYFVGGVLEAAAVSKVASLYTSQDIEQLELIVQKMKNIADENELSEHISDLDNEFHEVLFSRISNDFVIEFCHRSCQGLSKFLLFKFWIKLFSPQRVYKRHNSILTAIKGRDPVAIEAIIREHYVDAGNRMAQVSEEMKLDSANKDASFQ